MLSFLLLSTLQLLLQLPPAYSRKYCTEYCIIFVEINSVENDSLSVYDERPDNGNDGTILSGLYARLSTYL